MSESAPETQFSIYRIDYERVERVLSLEGEVGTKEYIESTTKAIINSCKKIVMLKKGIVQPVEYSGFRGIVFRTEHEPMWKEVIEQVLNGNKLVDTTRVEKASLLKNVNVSYILLYAYKDFIYALTGGFGSMYISKFADKNFGMYLIPKVVTISTPVLRSVLQNHLSGNQLSTQKSNRKVTNFSLERDMDSIFRQLNIEIDDEVAQAFGIILEPEERGKKISVVNKDSIVFHRSFNISEIKTMIQKMDEVWARKDNFALNYLVLAKKKNYKNSDIFDCLKRSLVAGDIPRFILVGDDYSNYIINGRHFLIYSEDEKEYFSSNNPITIQELFEQFVQEERSITLSFIDTFLKHWTLQVFDHDNNEIVPRLPIFESLQGFVEFGEKKDPIYLFNGEWYVFDAQYAAALTAEYKSAYDRYTKQTKSVLNSFPLRCNVTDEESYNKKIESLQSVIVAHRVLSDYVEIADAIFIDDEYLYLMHNKTKFSGEGVRDVTGQVITSAEYIQRKLSGLNRDDFLRSYYKKIVSKRKSMKQKITEDDFVIYFTRKKICYVVGYVKEFKKKTGSTYAEYLTVETERRLASKGYGFFSLLLTDKDA